MKRRNLLSLVLVSHVFIGIIDLQGVFRHPNQSQIIRFKSEVASINANLPQIPRVEYLRRLDKARVTGLKAFENEPFVREWWPTIDKIADTAKPGQYREVIDLYEYLMMKGTVLRGRLKSDPRLLRALTSLTPLRIEKLLGYMLERLKVVAQKFSDSREELVDEYKDTIDSYIRRTRFKDKIAKVNELGKEAFSAYGLITGKNEIYLKLLGNIFRPIRERVATTLQVTRTKKVINDLTTMINQTITNSKARRLRNIDLLSSAQIVTLEKQTADFSNFLLTYVYPNEIVNAGKIADYQKRLMEFRKLGEKIFQKDVYYRPFWDWLHSLVSRRRTDQLSPLNAAIQHLIDKGNTIFSLARELPPDEAKKYTELTDARIGTIVRNLRALQEKSSKQKTFSESVEQAKTDLPSAPNTPATKRVWIALLNEIKTNLPKLTRGEIAKAKELARIIKGNIDPANTFASDWRKDLTTTDIRTLSQISKTIYDFQVVAKILMPAAYAALLTKTKNMLFQEEIHLSDDSRSQFLGNYSNLDTNKIGQTQSLNDELISLSQDIKESYIEVDPDWLSQFLAEAQKELNTLAAKGALPLSYKTLHDYLTRGLWKLPRVLWFNAFVKWVHHPDADKPENASQTKVLMGKIKQLAELARWRGKFTSEQQTTMDSLLEPTPTEEEEPVEDELKTFQASLDSIDELPTISGQTKKLTTLMAEAAPLEEKRDLVVKKITSMVEHRDEHETPALQDFIEDAVAKTKYAPGFEDFPLDKFEELEKQLEKPLTIDEILKRLAATFLTSHPLTIVKDIALLIEKSNKATTEQRNQLKNIANEIRNNIKYNPEFSERLGTAGVAVVELELDKIGKLTTTKTVTPATTTPTKAKPKRTVPKKRPPRRPHGRRIIRR